MTAVLPAPVRPVPLDDPEAAYVLTRPQPDARFYISGSGALIVDYGSHGAWQAVHQGLTPYLSQTTTTLIVGILQRFTLSRLWQENGMEAFLAYWADARTRGAEVIWVLPGAAARNVATVRALKAAGHVVHAAAADGACFVEIHPPGDPDAQVGMLGPAL